MTMSNSENPNVQKWLEKIDDKMTEIFIFARLSVLVLILVVLAVMAHILIDVSYRL